MSALGHGRSHLQDKMALSLGGLQEIGPQAVSERGLVQRAASDIGVRGRNVQVDPHVGFLDRPLGHFFFLADKRKAVLALQNPESGGLAVLECEDGGVKTQATVQFIVEHRAVPMCSG